MTRDTFHDSDALLGVYANEGAAEAAARAAQRSGATRVRVAALGDVIASLDTEMQEEMTKSWASPQAFGVIPKEAAKGAAIGVPVAAAIGVLVVLPFAFLPIPGALTMGLWAKLLIAAIVGAVGGATVGFIAGAGFAAPGPAESMAAERGVTVRVDDGRPAVEQALRDAHPIRLDRLHPDGTTTTVFTEADAEPILDLRHLQDSVEHPGGSWPPQQVDGGDGRPQDEPGGARPHEHRSERG